MADHTAPVVKLALTLMLRWRLGACHDGRMGHNLAKTGTSPLKQAHYEAK